MSANGVALMSPTALPMLRAAAKLQKTQAIVAERSQKEEVHNCKLELLEQAKVICWRSHLCEGSGGYENIQFLRVLRDAQQLWVHD